MARPSPQILAREALQEAAAAVSVAAEILKPHADFFERYAREAESMDSVGPILNPTLFKDPERVAVDRFMRPIFAAARAFVRDVENQKRRAAEALAKVQAGSR